MSELGASGRRRYRILFSWATAVAAGATVAKSYRLEFNQPFYVEQESFAAFTTAAVGSNIPAGTPFAREFPGVDLAIPSLSLIDLTYDINGVQDSTDPLPALLTTGDGRHPAYPLTQWMIPAGQTTKVTLTNNSAVSCTAKLVLIGHLG